MKKNYSIILCCFLFVLNFQSKAANNVTTIPVAAETTGYLGECTLSYTGEVNAAATYQWKHATLGTKCLLGMQGEVPQIGVIATGTSAVVNGAGVYNLYTMVGGIESATPIATVEIKHQAMNLFDAREAVSALGDDWFIPSIAQIELLKTAGITDFTTATAWWYTTTTPSTQTAIWNHLFNPSFEKEFGAYGIAYSVRAIKNIPIKGAVSVWPSVNDYITHAQGNAYYYLGEIELALRSEPTNGVVYQWKHVTNGVKQLKGLVKETNVPVYGIIESGYKAKVTGAGTYKLYADDQEIAQVELRHAFTNLDSWKSGNSGKILSADGKWSMLGDIDKYKALEAGDFMSNEKYYACASSVTEGRTEVNVVDYSTMPISSATAKAWDSHYVRFFKKIDVPTSSDYVIENENKVIVYTTGNELIVKQNEPQTATITVYSLQGILCLSQTANFTELNLSLETLTEGVYIVKVNTAEALYTQKILKKN